MSLVEPQTAGQLRQVAELETSLLSRINAASDDLQRVDCLNEEQRAEVHAILEAMKHDSESHATVVGFLAGRSGQGAIHA
jgi:hypothetical protein